MSCPYESECINLNKLCFRCFDYSMYKPPKQRQGLRTRSLSNSQKKEGMDFENKGAKKYNQAIKNSTDVARRQLGSGALGHALGDVITEEQLTASLAEYKERGTLDARGSKQITIKKDWLHKVAEEAHQMGKDYFFLPFRFKGDDTEYVVVDYDNLLSYIQTIQTLLEQNRLLRLQLENQGGT